MSLKKSLLSLLLSAELFFSSCAINIKENFQDKKFYTLTQIQRCLHEKFEYFEDKKMEDRWDSPKTTIKKGGGDCEEIAILGAYFSEKLGYSPKIISLLDNSANAHMMVLIEEKKENKILYGAFDKDSIFYPYRQSIIHLIDDINKANFKNYHSYFTLDLNIFKKDWRTSKENLARENEDIVLDIIHFKIAEELRKSF